MGNTQHKSKQGACRATRHGLGTFYQRCICGRAVTTHRSHERSRMRLRREWLGLSCLLSSSRPVAGEVLWISNHNSMALRS
eukprot:scaffold32482_cov72-Phaeocystis_antarctica.AAC.4